MHGGVPKTNLTSENVAAVNAGLVNLEKHIENIKKYNLPLVVAINIFSQDTEAELQAIYQACERLGVEVALSDVFAQGGAGGLDLARKVIKLVDSNAANFQPLYPNELALKDKATKIAQEIYGAKAVTFAKEASTALAKFEALGYGHLPICMAKTQYSFSDDASLIGRPEGFTLNVRNAKISAGAGFIVLLTGDIMTMPGLPKLPAAEKIDIDESGVISGLF